MARLSAAERLKLPDRAFAYVDSKGARRLPIVDAAHVRNALARFDQVDFEDEDARDVARARLLRAAKKFRIVPVGFIDNQLRSERALGEARTAGAPGNPTGKPAGLPTGFVTMLMSDIEGSTALLDRLGDRYADLLGVVREVQRTSATEFDGCVVEERADEFFAVFESPRAALESAIAAQRILAAHPWSDDIAVRLRVGIHAGYPTFSDANYIGMAVHTAARVCAAAHGGQIVVSDDTRTALDDMVPDGVRMRKLGSFRLRGIPDQHTLFQITAAGLASRFPPLRV
jgi:class 3 adenylate cyclase